MRFQVLAVGRRPSPASRDHAFLVSDDWNDYWVYRTQYYLIYVDPGGGVRDVGHVKIGMVGLTADGGRPPIPPTFDSLSENFFSLGQDDTYYENLNKLGTGVRSEILSALNDIAHNEVAFHRAINEDVTQKSLLRGISTRTVTGQFRRIAAGGVRLTSYQFTYTSPEEHGLSLSFDVAPESRPPTNVHVLIGRNGVGKTRIMNAMANALLRPDHVNQTYGLFHTGGDERSSFVNLVFVSFSAFDLFRPLPRGERTNLEYTYVGLQTDDLQPKSPAALRDEFVNSVRNCASESTRPRWEAAMKLLESDPIFRDANPSSLISETSRSPTQPISYGTDSLASPAAELFDNFSSGHKIVLLTVTRLVEAVAERSLVLMDEPEAHLHPPLLSAFVRALSDLLISRNGAAIIATHSPVVLQEVPRSCVWKVRRSGRIAVCDRPELETFGENVGTLTSEVFGLEVTQSGFHNMLKGQVEAGRSYQDIVWQFRGQMGDEAKGIIQALIATRETDSGA
jgi:ABC-type multidrug transport system ATPase subunit